MKSIFVADDDKVVERYGRSNLFKLEQNQPDSEITADAALKSG